MLKHLISALIVMVAVPVAGVLAADVVKTANGSVEGVTEPAGSTCIEEFRSAPARRRSALEAAAAGRELDGRSPGRAVRPALHAARRSSAT